jgi:immune inhibitor A
VSGLVAACTGDPKSPAAQQAPQVAGTTVQTANQAAPDASPVVQPQRDLIDLGQRYRGIKVDPVPASPTATHTVGDTEQFAVLNQGSSRVDTVSAVLRAVTPHALFYFENGLEVDPADLALATKDFEDTVYPKTIAAIGQASVGPDGDQRIAILNLLSTGVGGYFTGQDQYPTVASPRSNGRNIVYINGRTPRLGSPSYSGVVSHELQHLLHWKQDHNEAAWINEGMSELAIEWVTERRNALDAFLSNPDMQLNNWPLSGGASPHYAGSYLFMRYLFQRLQNKDARALVAEQQDGIDGVRAFLRQAKSELSFEAIFADWTVANFANQPSSDRYGHTGLETRDLPVKSIATGETSDETVQQFGADYLELKSGTGPTMFRFEGSTSARVIPADAQQGNGFWWSGRGDGIDTMLTRELDLRNVSSATLRFWTWFSTEDGWDYAYVAASKDGGNTWQALTGKQTSTKNPFSLAYGPGYTGNSGSGTPAWVEEQMDLSPFAGQQVLIRFEYVTDDVGNGPGWAVDSIQVPEIGFSDDAESDVPGWVAQGYQRIEGPLPQRFIVQLLEFGNQLTVRQVPMDASNRAQVDIGGANRTVIVVSGATDGTTEPAAYRYSVSGR